MHSGAFDIINSKKLTKITLITFLYFLTVGFSALVVGPRVVEGTIETTPNIPVTLGTDFMPSNHTSYVQLLTTKITDHQPSFSCPY
jgi:ATP-dependent phosphoenolpyruvate carboxykinase